MMPNKKCQEQNIFQSRLDCFLEIGQIKYICEVTKLKTFVPQLKTEGVLVDKINQTIRIFYLENQFCSPLKKVH
jgi:hypothetical protein